MKKMASFSKVALFCAIAVALSAVSIGCSADGRSSFCKTGSLWPTSRTKKNNEIVYTTSATTSGNCDVAACDPCSPCAPDPCEPLCDPCAMNGMGSVMPTGFLPGPAN